MRTHSTSTRIRRTAAVVVAGVATGLVATAAVAANDRPETPSIQELQVERAEIADVGERTGALRSLPGVSAAGGRMSRPARHRIRSTAESARVREGQRTLRHCVGRVPHGLWERRRWWCRWHSERSRCVGWIIDGHRPCIDRVC